MIIAAVIYSWFRRSRELPAFLELPIHTRNNPIFLFFLLDSYLDRGSSGDTASHSTCAQD